MYLMVMTVPRAVPTRRRAESRGANAALGRLLADAGVIVSAINRLSLILYETSIVSRFSAAIVRTRRTIVRCAWHQRRRQRRSRVY